MPSQRKITTGMTKLEDFPVPPWAGILGAGVIKLLGAFITQAKRLKAKALEQQRQILPLQRLEQLPREITRSGLNGNGLLCR